MLQYATSDAGSKVCVRGELPGRGTGAGSDQSDSLPLSVFYQLDGLSDVAVVGGHNGTVVTIEPSVIQQVYGKIDIGSLFLGLDHVHEVLGSPWDCKAGRDGMRQEVTVMDTNFGAEPQ